MQMSLTRLAIANMQKKTFCQTFQNLFTSCVNSQLDLLQTGRVKALLLNIIFLINTIKAINQPLLVELDVNYKKKMF